jgi:hypothetical protein
MDIIHFARLKIIHNIFWTEGVDFPTNEVLEYLAIFASYHFVLQNLFMHTLSNTQADVVYQ